MKRFHKILLLLSLTLSVTCCAYAQDEREDVMYLKNGNIYRGMIIEQVPGETMKIETIGGNVFTVAISEIVKITKEKKIALYNPTSGPSEDMHHEHPYYDRREYRDYHSYRDTAHRALREYHFRKKGYLFQAQLHLDFQSGGLRIVNGYRFGRFGQLGIGVGADMIGSPIIGDNGRYSNYQGLYAPVFLYYSGDITRKRITPFYALEAGWAFSMNGRGPMAGPFNNENDNKGGAMGSATFGVKFQTRRRGYFSLAANLESMNIRAYQEGHYDNYGNYIDGRYDRRMLFLPGIKLAIGF